MIINGVIEDVIYRNEDNGYTVVNVSSKNELITAVGKFPIVNEGQNVSLDGTYVKNSKYGEQFKCDNVQILKPTTIDGIKRYLGSGLIYGVGPVTASKIVDYFGKDTLNIIEMNPDELAKVNGVSLNKAREIGESFAEIKDMQNAIMFLQDYDITINMSIKIYGTYKNKTIEILKQNPYKLVEDIDGIGFLTADKIAQKMGIPQDSEFRVRAGILHILKEGSEKSGNTYLPRAKVYFEVLRLLGLNEEKHSTLIDTTLSKLAIDNLIKIFDKDDKSVIMLTFFNNIEKGIANKLCMLLLSSQNTNINIDSEISLFEKLNHLTFHIDQVNAIKMAVNEGVCVITGGPGTGKTTIIKCIIQILKSMNLSIKLLAPTGRAAKRLNESTGEEASTIHRALDLNFTDREGGFTYNENTPLPFDVVIVDEVSMVDARLMYYLIKPLKNGTKLILVGDKDQLPSVGAGNVLADILNSNVIKVSYLTKIYRQDDKSLIVSNAHLINSGEMPLIDNTSKDFFFQELSDPNEIRENILDMMTSRIPKFLNTDPSKIQILAPMKAGICGVDNLNNSLQEKLNPPSLRKNEVVVGHYILRTGDKVMQIANNYDTEWTRVDELNRLVDGKGVFNGDIGYIQSIDIHTKETTVIFEDGRKVIYGASDLIQLVLSYAITIHKSQGSEFDVVIMPIISGAPIILTRNLLYTAVTRAKKMVVLVGEKKNLKRMIKNNYTAERFSMLKDYLVSSYSSTMKLFGENNNDDNDNKK
jgi:exodeoxyribonuclease V alpha subunit